jgi:hypothetical protein
MFMEAVRGADFSRSVSVSIRSARPDEGHQPRFRDEPTKLDHLPSSLAPFHDPDEGP